MPGISQTIFTRIAADTITRSWEKPFRLSGYPRLCDPRWRFDLLVISYASVIRWRGEDRDWRSTSGDTALQEERTNRHGRTGTRRQRQVLLRFAARRNRVVVVATLTRSVCGGVQTGWPRRRRAATPCMRCGTFIPRLLCFEKLIPGSVNAEGLYDIAKSN